MFNKMAGDLPVQAPVIGFDDAFGVYKILKPLRHAGSRRAQRDEAEVRVVCRCC